MLNSADGSIAKIQFLDIFDLIFFTIFEECGYLKDLIVKSIEEDVIVLFFKGIFDYFIIVQCSEECDVWFQKSLLDEGPTDGAWYWLVVISLQHAPDANIAEVVRVGTS